MKERVVSGIRPTGRLHWGHYFGIMQDRLRLQKDYECFFFIADWHALTSEYANSEIIKPSVIDIIADLLAVGFNPEDSVLFIQSCVPEHAELHVLLSMTTPLGWLERVPSYKDMQQNLKDKDLSNYGFLGYPVLQTADIVMYKATKVPVGEDQVAHVELCREIVRRFNHLMKQEVFVEPQPILTKHSRIPCIDGRKMSKSFNNAIYIADDDETIRKKMMQAITDPARKLKNDPGHPEVCNIFSYHKLFTDNKKVGEIEKECRAGIIGCVDCKKICIQNAIDFWTPIRNERIKWIKEPEKILAVVKEGAEKARKEAVKTMKVVRKAVGIEY